MSDPTVTTTCGFLSKHRSRSNIYPKRMISGMQPDIYICIYKIRSDRLNSHSDKKLRNSFKAELRNTGDGTADKRAFS